MGKIKTVIFDIDGTMYDYTECNRLGLAALEDYCSKHFALDHTSFTGVFLQGDQNLQQRVGYTSAAIHNRLIRFQCMLELLEKPLFPHALAMYHCYWDTFLAGMEPYPGLVGWMRQLKAKGITVAVGTNMTAYIQYKKLEQLGVADLIQWMVTSEEAGVEKPDPGFYRLCLEKCGCCPEECLFVGDSRDCDAVGPLQAGMQAVLFDPQGKETDQADSGYRRIESYEQASEQD